MNGLLPLRQLSPIFSTSQVLIFCPFSNLRFPTSEFNSLSSAFFKVLDKNRAGAIIEI
jgi:hypothetical protein